MEKFFLVGDDGIVHSLDNDWGCLPVAVVSKLVWDALFCARLTEICLAALYWLEYGLFSSTVSSLRIEEESIHKYSSGAFSTCRQRWRSIWISN